MKTKQNEQERLGTAVRNAEKVERTVNNKTKVLLLSTRGIVSRYRHLLDDLRRLLPHAKREPKLDSKGRLAVANEIAELRGCDTILLLEARKRCDLFMHIAKSPLGPTVRFHVSNVHTMGELGFSGNCLMFSRALLVFDKCFDESPAWMLVKEMLMETFAAPLNHRKTKPFVDHVMTFYVVDGRIWFRHYQIVDAAPDEKKANKVVVSAIVEIGPRMVLTPIRIFSGGLCGATLWQNEHYISPNEVRRAIKRRQGDHTIRKTIVKKRHEEHVKRNKPSPDPVRNVFRE
eukprot:Plantae.Rhodophyta-Hildenbrandia_rubra.ctg45583.p1 GENE.Plantae.Rhodophyta-Hildenbrandia_rubra.ctg45583~~Plantae.Rhodophyta-Hildenbrandia_rubra.ctg45583.p1  ORF type:complete len:305 (+),score=48.12 Plantae.Rhodophyta-Hildenbrandia_rubra.ctg45583:53-916(+)